MLVEMINQTQVKTWLQNEGLFFQDQPGEMVAAQWSIRVPIDPQQSINMAVAIPKGKEDQVYVQMTVIPGQESQTIFVALQENQKKEVLRAIAEEFLRAACIYPVFGQRPDGTLTFVLGARVFEEVGGLSKGRLMEAIFRLQRAFLLYELFYQRIFKPYSPTDELLKP